MSDAPHLDFNKLSLYGKIKLYTASGVDATGDIMREDTKRNPWMFPVYAFIVAPNPIPAHSVVGLAALYGWARLGLTDGARQIDDRLKTAFNEKAMMETYKDFIVPDEDRPGGLAVKDFDLAKHSGKKTVDDIWASTKHAWSGLRDWVDKNGPKF